MVKPRPILSDADLRDAVLSGAVGNKWTMLPDGWQVTGAGVASSPEWGRLGASVAAARAHNLASKVAQ